MTIKPPRRKLFYVSVSSSTHNGQWRECLWSGIKIGDSAKQVTAYFDKQYKNYPDLSTVATNLLSMRVRAADCSSVTVRAILLKQAGYGRARNRRIA